MEIGRMNLFKASIAFIVPIWIATSSLVRTDIPVNYILFSEHEASKSPAGPPIYAKSGESKLSLVVW